MSIWERLSNFDRRWYYILLVIVVSWPIVRPWGLPIKTGAESQKFYDTVNAVPQGGTVVIDIEYRTDSVVEMNPMLITAFRVAMAQGLKVIVWSGVDEGANLSQSVLTPLAAQLGSKYGTDWINLGFKPAGNATLQKMVDNFPEAVAYSDMAGKPLDQFPIMNGFTSITKANLIVCLNNVTPSCAVAALTMISLPHGTPLAVGTGSVAVPNEMPYFSSGQYRGLLCGLRGAAEYELLTKNPGSAIMGMDSQSAAHILVILLIVVGNLGYFLGKKPGARGTNKGGEAA